MVYIPVMLKKFWLVEELPNAVNVPAIVESFFFCEGKVDNAKISTNLILISFAGRTF
jgi:hypothetical protein